MRRIARTSPGYLSPPGRPFDGPLSCSPTIATVLVSREFRFEAAHQLPDHPGKCRRLHGHGYRLRVVCAAPVDPRTGIAVDFYDVKRIVTERVVDALDHTYLNELLPAPSAEHIAVWIWKRLVGSGLPLVEVVLFESDDCFVTYRGEDPATPGTP
jgi:6-pyruvoyltetrahydropterin/6-carboxytetrahydropterin synthase